MRPFFMSYVRGEDPVRQHCCPLRLRTIGAGAECDPLPDNHPEAGRRHQQPSASNQFGNRRYGRGRGAIPGWRNSGLTFRTYADVANGLGGMVRRFTPAVRDARAVKRAGMGRSCHAGSTRCSASNAATDPLPPIQSVPATRRLLQNAPRLVPRRPRARAPATTV